MSCGAILGAELARLADELAPLHPDVPERCKTCAFRSGTVPNTSAGTLVDALRCISKIDAAPFGCHHTLKDGAPTAPCSGYVLAMRADRDKVLAAMDVARRRLELLPQETECP